MATAGTLQLSDQQSPSSADATQGRLLWDDTTKSFHQIDDAGAETDLAEAGAVDSVFGRTGVVVAVSGDYDADEISETASNKIMTAAERTKLAGLAAQTGYAQLDTDLNDSMKILDGAFLDSPVVSVTSDGATVTLTITGDSSLVDFRVKFSDNINLLDVATANCTLTAGSDTSPTLNYIYVLKSTMLLTCGLAWPTEEYAPVATVLCQSAGSVQTDGPYKVHAWTDHISNSDNGHLAHLNFWVRQQNATWVSGVDQTLTITTNGGSPDNVVLTTASGLVLQLHEHAFPAFSGTPDVYVVNDSVTPYTVVTDLNALLTDSLGNSMAGRRFSLVVWGCVSEESGDCKLFVNLPSGDYGTNTAVIQDANKYADYSIPSEFVGTGFLIAELKLRHQSTSGGTWTEIETVDLRGLFPSVSAGGGAAAGSEFIDNVFRVQAVADNTKEIALDASAITTATTRTISMADKDIDLADIGLLRPQIAVGADNTDNVVAVGVIAAGSVDLTGGGSGSVDSITVDGVEIMSGSEAFDTDLATTAAAVAANINAYSSVPNYYGAIVDSSGTKIDIYADYVGTGPNGYAVVSTATTITTADVAVGTEVAGVDPATRFRLTDGQTFSEVRAALDIPAMGATLFEVDICVGIDTSGAVPVPNSILSTNITVDAGSRTSVGAATAAVISDASHLDDEEVTVDVVAVGNTRAGGGLKIALLGARD
jgi:hypothetical protein